jgi:hypothetical protein
MPTTGSPRELAGSERIKGRRDDHWVVEVAVCASCSVLAIQLRKIPHAGFEQMSRF